MKKAQLARWLVLAVLAALWFLPLVSLILFSFAPPAEVLKQLGDKIEALYRPPQPIPGEKPKPPCEKCAGVGYYGRTGIFEVLVVNDAVRQALDYRSLPRAIGVCVIGWVAQGVVFYILTSLARPV